MNREVQGFEKETFGRFCITCWIQEKLSCVALRVDCSIEVDPLFFYLDGGLIHFPGVVAGFEVRPTALLQFRGVALHSARDGGVINRMPSLNHHFFEVAIAQSVSEVPAHTQQNDVGLEMTPLERILLGHV